ncbi:haloacid dehalogenase-like hydrolase [Pasteurella multocida]|nr:haloacid dehalogenase-like hydrolase [Pasteurella multocida]
MKRLLDCTASDFQHMNGQQLKQAIRASEGRVILSENMVAVQPLYPNVTNSELAAAFGADLILLNLFDVFNPKIQGLETEPAQIVRQLKRLVGRPIGINLEPVDVHAAQIETLDTLEKGRLATTEALQQAKTLGFDFVCLTGNPKTGVTNTEIVQAIKRARAVLGEDGLIIAGKMHGAGVANETGSGLISEQDLVSFIEAGADIILLAAPGTIPGMTVERVEKYVQLIHAKGALALLAIGTSQEGADEATIRQIALNSKMAGADLYHIGDAGFYGIAVPENIMTYSIAIRGRRHTYVRMALSTHR